MLWVLHSTANAQITLRTNLAPEPVDTLPPAAVDGNLHACYTMHANAAGVEELEPESDFEPLEPPLPEPPEEARLSVR